MGAVSLAHVLGAGVPDNTDPAPSSPTPSDKLWIHVYAKEGIQDFYAYPLKNVNRYRLTVSSENEAGELLYDNMEILLKSAPKKTIPLSDIDYFEIAADLPVIDIRLDEYPERKELWDKELYLDATVNIDGAGEYEDVENWSTKIKGRGNTTWNMPKKPYRFKASKKISLLGMKKAKSYALIANYIDPTHMHNYVTQEVAKRLGMPFTNSCVPVRVKLNGFDKGLYFLTEKIGIGGASVDIDENTGVLFELDTQMDEDYCYFSEPFHLPVMIKDPDLTEIYDDPEAKWASIQQNLNSALSQLQNSTDESWQEIIDAESLVNYLIVFNLCRNPEIHNPRSVYMYHPSDNDKYYMGPIWDFDWALEYSSSGLNTVNPASCLLASYSTTTGGAFFYKLTQLPGFMDMFREKWDMMATEIFPQLLEDMDAYAHKITPAAKSDGVLWPDKSVLKTESSFDFDIHYQNLKTWLQTRLNASLTHPNRLLY